MKVYVVGRWAEPWELEAAYATEAEAIAACDEPEMFYVPMTLGERYETSEERRIRVAAGIPPADLEAIYPPLPTLGGAN